MSTKGLGPSNYNRFVNDRWLFAIDRAKGFLSRKATYYHDKNHTRVGKFFNENVACKEKRENNVLCTLHCLHLIFFLK